MCCNYPFMSPMGSVIRVGPFWNFKINKQIHELALQAKLASSSQRSACLCLLLRHSLNGTWKARDQDVWDLRGEVREVDRKPRLLQIGLARALPITAPKEKEDSRRLQEERQSSVCSNGRPLTQHAQSPGFHPSIPKTIP